MRSAGLVPGRLGRMMLFAALLPAQLAFGERPVALQDADFDEEPRTAAVQEHPAAAAHIELKAAAHADDAHVEPPAHKEPAQAKAAHAAAAHLDAAPEAALVQQHAGTDAPKSEEKKPEEKKPEEKKPEEKKSGGGLMGGLASFTNAATDPRGTLLGNSVMQPVIAAFKLALDASPQKGMCLTSGEFTGYGCQDDAKAPALCKCGGMLDQCFVPTTNAMEIGKKLFSGQVDQAKTEALQFLFGQCKLNYILVGAIAAGGLVLLIIIICVLKSVLGKKSNDDD